MTTTHVHLHSRRGDDSPSTKPFPAPSRIRCTLSLGAATAIVALATTGKAEEEFAVDYAAPTECPSREQLLKQVGRRLPKWRHSESASRRFHVDVRTNQDAYVGEILLEAGVPPRRVQDKSCTELIDALALIVAVTMDPVAALSTEANEPQPTKRSTKLHPNVQRRKARRSTTGAELPTTTDSAQTTSPSFGFGAGGGLLFGPAKGALYGALVNAEIGSEDETYSVGLSVSQLLSERVDVAPSRIRFKLRRGRLGLCYRPLTGTVGIAGCVAGELGIFDVTTENHQALESVANSSRFWAAGGGDGRVHIELAPQLRLLTSAELSAAFTRHSYFFENPQETVHTVGPLSVGLWAGVAFSNQ